MKMDPKFEKANEIYFRLGIIYKQQQKYDLSLQVSINAEYGMAWIYVCADWKHVFLVLPLYPS